MLFRSWESFQPPQKRANQGCGAVLSSCLAFGLIGRVSENSRRRPVYWWRYEFGGRWYEERDEAAPSWQLDLAFSFAPNKRYGTVYVDPAYPSRLLPPSWKARLAIFIEAVVLYVFAAAYALICI